MKMDEMNKVTTTDNSTNQMPVLFLGHGSPMNAIQENEFVLGWRDISNLIRKA